MTMNYSHVSTYDRGGQVLKTGKIGRMNVLRQQLMFPGETIKPRLNGNCKLEVLRERDALRINARIDTFLTPLRWLWPEYPAYVRQEEGVAPPTVSTTDWSRFGVGGFSTGTPRLFKPFLDSVLRIYNEYYKWPEAADALDTDLLISSNTDGMKLMPLPMPWNRARDSMTPANVADHEYNVTNNVVDVVELNEIYGKFKSAMQKGILSFDRWQPLIKEIFGAGGSNEVDQIPFLIDSVETGVNPRDVPATDGASLGQWMSLYDFDIEHSVGPVTAPEHAILTYVMAVRFPSITENDVNPFANHTNPIPYADMTGDPTLIATAPPENTLASHHFNTGGSAGIGYLPSGWRARTGWNMIGTRIDNRATFPLYQEVQGASTARDATYVNNAFRSSALGDYVVDLFFKEKSTKPLPSAKTATLSGIDGTSHSTNEFNVPHVR